MVLRYQSFVQFCICCIVLANGIFCFAEQPIEFEDPFLKQIVEAYLNTSDPTLSDMERLKKLEVRDDVYSLEGLQNAVALEELRFYGTTVCFDLSPIENLTSLKMITIIDADVLVWVVDGITFQYPSDISVMLGPGRPGDVDCVQEDYYSLHNMCLFTPLSSVEAIHLVGFVPINLGCLTSNQILKTIEFRHSDVIAEDVLLLKEHINSLEVLLEDFKSDNIFAFTQMRNLNKLFINRSRGVSFNEDTYCYDIPLIKARNPGVEIETLPRVRGITCDTSEFKVNQCLVQPGRRSNTDSIKMSGDVAIFPGILEQVQNATVEIVNLDSDVPILSMEQSASFKKETLIAKSRLSNGKITLSLTNDAFSLGISKTDLTGLQSPFDLKISLDDYDFTLRVGEDVINGQDPLSPNFLMGMTNSMTIENLLLKLNRLKSEWEPPVQILPGITTQGRWVDTIYGFISIKGGFSFVGDPNTFSDNDVTFYLDNKAFTILDHELIDHYDRNGTLIKRVARTKTLSFLLDFEKGHYLLQIKKGDITPYLGNISSGSFSPKEFRLNVGNFNASSEIDYLGNKNITIKLGPKFKIPGGIIIIGR